MIFGISLVYIKLEYITRKQVKTIISEDLGVKKEMLDNYNINLKRKNKKFIYMVTFKYMNEIEKDREKVDPLTFKYNNV